MATREEDEDHCTHRIGEICQKQRDHSIWSVLELNYKGLKQFPPKLTVDIMFTKIERLYMKMNMLTSLPEDIGNMSGLMELYLPYNQLQDLPQGLADLKKLQNLNISNNCFSFVPMVVYQLKSLRKLQISCNNLTSIHPDIGKLQNLITLEAVNNKLAYLPEELAKCSMLSSLILDKNQLGTLPSQLCHLHHLSEISLCDNNLHILPQDIGNISNLKAIHVDNNKQLHTVPASIYQKQCGVHRCCQAPVSAEILKMYPNLEFCEDGQEVRKILLPTGLRTLGNNSDHSVATLLELTYRHVYTRFLLESTGEKLLSKEMPKELFRILSSPTCHCDYCHTPVFVMGYPVVLRVQINKICILSICCSGKCSRLYPLTAELPLVYPSS